MSPNKQFFSSLIQLTCWLLLSNLVACQRSCGLKHANDIKLTLSINQSIVEEPDNQLVLTIQNLSADQRDAAADQIQLIATIEAEVDGSGSQFMYKPAEGDEVETRVIEKALRHFTGNAELEAADAEQLTLTLIPGPAVSTLNITLQLVDLTSGSNLATETVQWKAKLPQIKCEQVIPAHEMQPGSLTLRVEEKAIDPKQIDVAIKANSAATFLWNNKPIESIQTLADLLGEATPIQPGTSIGPIAFQLADANGAIDADISLQLSKNKQDIYVDAQPIKWSKKDLQLNLVHEAFAFDAEKETIHYTIKKSGKVLVEAADRLNLFYQTNNQATLEGEQTKAIYLDEAALKQLNEKGQYKGALQLQFNDEFTTDISFILKQGDHPLDQLGPMTCTEEVKTEEVKLAFEEFRFITADKKLRYSLINNGKAKANKEFMGLHIENASDAESKFKDELLLAKEKKYLKGKDFVGDLDLEENQSSEGFRVLIDFLTNKAVFLILQPTYKGQPMGHPKNVVWKKEPSFSLSHEPTIDKLRGSQQKQVKLILKNTTGRDLTKEELQNITLRYKAVTGNLKYQGTNGEMDINGLTKKPITILFAIENLEAGEEKTLLVDIESNVCTIFDVILEGTEEAVSDQFSWQP